MVDLYETVIDRIHYGLSSIKPEHNYELREIEGGLCEFDKYSRIFKKEGRTRSIYKHNDLPIVEDLINGESKWER